jgi:hypothetical protein
MESLVQAPQEETAKKEQTYIESEPVGKQEVEEKGDSEGVVEPEVDEDVAHMAAVEVQLRISRPYGFPRGQQSEEGA